MGTLALAGAVSGMGQGLERGLASLQHGIIQQGLLESSQAFQAEKIKEQMAHAERLNDKTIAANASEHALDRTATEGLLQTKIGADIVGDTRKIDADERGDTRKIESAEKIHGMDEASREKIATEGNAMQKSIADASNAMHLKVAEMQNKLGHATLKATELSALQHDMDSVRDSLDRVDIKLMDPLADPDSAIGKSLRVAQTAERKRLTHLEALMEARVVDMQTKDGITLPKEAAPVQRKPFNPGQYGTAPAPGALQQTR